MIVILASCAAPRQAPRATPATPSATLTAIRATLEPGTLPSDDGDELVHTTVSEFSKIYGAHTGPGLVTAHDLPPHVAPTAPAGINLFARGKNVGWVIDGDPQHGYALIYDENANGDLRDDPPHAFAPIEGGFELALLQSSPTREGGAAPPWPTRLRIRHGTLFVQDQVTRRGVIAIEGHRHAIELRAAGQYDNDSNTVAIDLDGDGVPGVALRDGDDPRSRWSREIDSPEVIRLAQPMVNIGARTYDVAVDPSGDRVTLTPRAVRMPDRTTLQVGSVPPDFTVDDLDGQRLQLAALRGHPVLIDFWATGCGPCLAALPTLAALAERHPDLTIVSLAGDDSADDIRATLARYPHAGRVAQYGDALARTYRIYATPTYFVVAADGRIAVARGRIDDVLAYFDRRRD